jgi:hypothetical protein
MRSDVDAVLARFAARNSSAGSVVSKVRKERNVRKVEESLYSGNSIGFLASVPAKAFGSSEGGRIGFLAGI